MSVEKAWICTICGYIHHDSEPPEVCPVCGVAKENFKPYTLVPSTNEPLPTKAWRCLNCEYIHKDNLLPNVCPVCGASPDRFEPFTTQPPMLSNKGGKKKFVIVGAGIAGISAAESLRTASPESEIVCISKESTLPYYRLNLTRYLAGEIEEDQLQLYPKEWYEAKKISLLNGTTLHSIDSIKKRLICKGSEDISYDTLLLTIGSHPFIPPFPGVNKKNITILRTKEDVKFLIEKSKDFNHCVVIGGGLLGLETAGALAKRSMNVSVLEGHDWILPRQLNKKAAKILESYINSLNITMHKNARVKEFSGDEAVKQVVLDSNESIPTELVVITAGVRSNSYIARQTGLDVNKGVIVNNYLQTSNPDIYAAGDVCEHRGVLYGTWGPSQFQGSIAGTNAGGGSIEFFGIPRSNMLKVLGVDMFSIGQIISEDASYQMIDGIIEEDYFYFLFQDNLMKGAILLGDTKLSYQVKSLIENKKDCFSLIQQKNSIRAVCDLIQQEQ